MSFLSNKFFQKTRSHFISIEEYNEQAQDFTAQALEDLRNYCKSSNCDSWDVMRRLKNPTRFVVLIKKFYWVELL
jgi:hypothetical protein